MGAWMEYELGHYDRALRDIADGEAAIEGLGAENLLIHLHAWKAATMHRLGRWDEALQWFESVRDMLDDRRDRPPYFACHAFGTAGLIHTARGDRVRSDELARILTPLLTGASGRLYPWLLRLHLIRGDLATAAGLERPTVWRVHAGEAYGSESELAYATRDGDRATALLEEMRRYAEESGSPVLPFADRLEGRFALLEEDRGRALTLLTAAVDGFEQLGCPWERALTILDLGKAQRAAGHADEAFAAFSHAKETFEKLGAIRDLTVANDLLAG
jgi:tetratricopeptide (TPR) repeat protein